MSSVSNYTCEIERRLEDHGLVPHKGNYGALRETEEVAAYVSMVKSTRAAKAKFGKEDMDK